jgi:hypothetical protein
MSRFMHKFFMRGREHSIDKNKNKKLGLPSIDLFVH